MILNANEASASKTLYSLQIGRALAALMVVVAHVSMATIFLYPQMPAQANNWLKLGHFGVDYFFTLSGFIIAHATMKLDMHAMRDARLYIRSRLIRIYSPYLPISLVMLMAFMFFPTASMGDTRPISLLGSLLLVPSEHTPALIVARTLQHEMVFYLLYGLCYFWLRRPLLIYLWLLPIIAQSMLGLREPANILAGSINLEFLFGLTAHHCYRRGWFSKQRYGLLIVGAALVAIASDALLRGAITAHFRLLAGLGFAVLMLGAVYLEKAYDFSRFKLLLFMGAASYSIYLIHLAVVSVWMRLPLSFSMWQASCIAAIVVCVLVGVGYFLLIEKPLLAAIKRTVRIC